jgi:predicted RNA-binding Zn ribbon-like protein
MTPDTLLALTNLTTQRRPDRGPTIHPDPLASAATAAQALGLSPVEAVQVGALRDLHQTVAQLVDGLLDGRSVDAPAARLAELAKPSTATVRIDVGENHTLRPRLEWSDPTAVATLARRVALELAEIDLARLRRCERSQCHLVFYDTTRSGTRRWHAESPCGVRERQRRYRTASRTSSAGRGPLGQQLLQPMIGEGLIVERGHLDPAC